MKMKGNRIYLKLLSPDDITQNYVSWMQDEKVVQFLESRWKVYTLENLKEYVKLMNESTEDYFLGIFLKEKEEHIGNIKIGEINQLHRFGDVGLIIGNKDVWGKGYGTETIELVTLYGFDELNLNKLKAGMYANNIGSYKAFIKAGYMEIGRFKNHRFYKGSYVDEILLEKGKD